MTKEIFAEAVLKFNFDFTKPKANIDLNDMENALGILKLELNAQIELLQEQKEVNDQQVKIDRYKGFLTTTTDLLKKATHDCHCFLLTKNKKVKKATLVYQEYLTIQKNVDDFSATLEQPNKINEWKLDILKTYKLAQNNK